MNLLITGAWHATQEQLDAIRALGHTVLWHQMESDPLPCPYDQVDGTICNGLFLHHPIEKFTNLKYIQLTSAGYDRVPMDYVNAHGIEIHNACGVYSTPMAEHVLASVLCLYRRLFDFHASQLKGQWTKLRNLRELNGQHVLILGCGSVGSTCAARFKAFKCQVTGIDLIQTPNPAFDQILPMDQLHAQLPTADILLVTLPKTPDTINLIGASELALLPANATVCNIARGGIIDEEALTAELKTLRITACLDVFDTEPLFPSSPLWQLPNVLITPHNSFVGDKNSQRLAEVIVKNLSSLIKETYSQRFPQGF